MRVSRYRYNNNKKITNIEQININTHTHICTDNIMNKLKRIISLWLFICFPIFHWKIHRKIFYSQPVEKGQCYKSTNHWLHLIIYIIHLTMDTDCVSMGRSMRWFIKYRKKITWQLRVVNAKCISKQFFTESPGIQLPLSLSHSDEIPAILLWWKLAKKKPTNSKNFWKLHQTLEYSMHVQYAMWIPN